MNRDLHKPPFLSGTGAAPLRRPLIGVTMGREKSQRFLAFRSSL